MLNQNLLLTGDDGYNLTNSLRFRSSASAYLTRTPAAAGSQTTWTWSGWIKRGSLGSLQSIFASGSGGSVSYFGFTSSDTLTLLINGSSSVFTTNQVFRDPSAWYHIVLQFNTTDATSSNRIKLYINGVQVSSFSSISYPAQNTTSEYNAALQHWVSSFLSVYYFDGYITENYFIDGQALTPSSFGETDVLTGVWKPKKYAGTYGTNGFYLPFTDNSALTTSSNVGLGKDFSGNGNYWTTNNISITAGTTYDSMTDVPTLTNATTANYAVLNPLGTDTPTVSNGTLNGNLTLSNSGSNQKRATIICAGADTNKYYWEVTINGTATGNFPNLGMYMVGAGTNWVGYDGNSIGLYQGGGLYYNGSLVATLTSFANGDVIGIAYDASSGKIWFAKNNTWMASGVPSTGASPNYTLPTGVDRVAGGYTGSGYGTLEFNFGQQGFKYTPPTGFVALNTFNLPDSTIGATASNRASKHFNVGTYTGTGSASALAVVGADTPDLVWIKGRSGASSHSLLDKLRDSADPFSLRLYSNATNAEYDYGSSLLTPTSTGFNLTTSDADHNTNTGTYVAWSWKANGTAVTNTAGSISAQVSANTTAGFSIVTYTGTGVTGTIGHGLGVAPAMIIVKSRSNASNWYTYHQSIGNTGAVALNLTNATITSANFWNNTSPTSSVFTASAGSAEINGNGLTYVAYCFAEVAGYSKFGSYTGNGSADGPFVFTGFRPRFILTKGASTSGSWWLYDTARSTYNEMTDLLRPDLANADTTQGFCDAVSNGFKIRNSGNNNSGATYIYMAFAENPFKYSLAR